MAQFTTLTSRIMPLPVNDIDTDQIIPARFLKATDKKGMGDDLFADWRYNADGTPKKDFVLNNPAFREHKSFWSEITSGAVQAENMLLGR